VVNIFGPDRTAVGALRSTETGAPDQARRRSVASQNGLLSAAMSA
jgi:hypothetical protein